MIHRARRSIGRPTATAARHDICQVSPKGWRVKPVDNRVAARVQVSKHKEHVVNVLWRVLDHSGVEPVPDPQQVVRGPADDKRANDDHRHLEGLHPSFRDDVSSTASQAIFIICTKQRNFSSKPTWNQLTQDRCLIFTVNICPKTLLFSCCHD